MTTPSAALPDFYSDIDSELGFSPGAGWHTGLTVWDKVWQREDYVDIVRKPSQRENTQCSQKIVIGAPPDGINLGCSTNIGHSDFLFANFSHSTLINVKFIGSDLHYADFICAELHGVDFQGASLNDVKFASASLVRVSFKSANLTDIDFAETKDVFEVELPHLAVMAELDADGCALNCGSDDLLTVGMSYLQTIGITGLIPVKLVKSKIPPEENPNHSSDHYPFEYAFASSYCDVAEDEVFKPDIDTGSYISAGRFYDLAICCRIAGSQDPYGQIRFCIDAAGEAGE